MANKIVTKDVLINTLKDVAESVNEINDQVNKPQVINIEHPNNTASVGLDTSGTKYNMIESPETTIELNGRTLVNLTDQSRAKKSDNYGKNFILNADGTIAYIRLSLELFKPNTKYTVRVIDTENILKNCLMNGLATGLFECNKNILITSKSDIGAIYQDKLYVLPHIYPKENITLTKENTANIRIICLEGDYTDVPVEYFEGLKSAGETKGIEVKTIGKNLFNTDIYLEKIKGQEYTSEGGNLFKNPLVSKGDNNNSLILKSSAYQEYLTKYKLPYNGTYTISANFDEFYDLNNENASFKIFYWVEGQAFELIRLNSPMLGENIKMTFTGDAISIGGWSYYGTAKLSNIQLEYYDSVTPYEPYKEQVTTLPEIEPLRSLPSGVCDEAFIHDDKLVVTRNCAEIVLDGTETWTYNTSTNYFGIQPKHIEISNYKPLSVKGLADSIRVASIDKNDLAIQNGATSYVFIIKNTNYQTLEDFISWLQNNVITYVYELATPTYEWYELPSPHLYKDGHLFIETGAIPLTSNSHEVDVSVRSVIDTNVEEIRQLKERHDVLENDMFKETEVYIEEDFNTFTISDNAVDTNDTEIKLNGRTLVNLTHTEFSGSYEFACDSVNVINTAYTKEKTSNSVKITLLEDLTSWNYIRAGYVRHEMLKPNTQYTAIFEKAVGVANVKISNGGGNIKYAEPHNIINNKALITTLATLPTPTSNNYVHMFVNLYKATAGHVAEVSNVLLLEGDWTNVDIPTSYFEGLKSAEPTKLVSYGKNLFDINNILGKNNNPTYTINNDGISINSNGVSYVSLTYQFAVEPNTYYTLSYRSSSTYLADTRARLYIFGENGSYIDGRTPSGQYAITFSSANNKLIKFTLYATIETAYNATVTFENIQLEKGTEVTPYEPCISDTVTLPEIEPLRSLPNGVCDTMEIKDDKLVITRKCGECILTKNTSSWIGVNETTDTHTQFNINTNFIKNIAFNINNICNKMLRNGNVSNSNNASQGYTLHHENVLVIRVPNDLLTTLDVGGFNEWLESNPLTFVYELKTPVIEEYDLRSLHLYKHFFANTGAIPLTSNTHNEHYTTKDVIVSNTEELLIAKKNIARLEGIIEQLLARIATLETANASVEE